MGVRFVLVIHCLTRLYIVMASRSVLNPYYTRKATIGIAFKIISSLWEFAFLKRVNSG